MAGRPTEYQPDYCEQVEKLCKLGATDKEIASFFEIVESTLNNWKIAHPEFMESIQKGKLLADANVADALYQRAIGYKHVDTDIRVIEGKVIETEITKQYPPDTAAAFIWLKNRQKGKWKDKSELETTNTNLNINTEPISSDKAKKIKDSFTKDF